MKGIVGKVVISQYHHRLSMSNYAEEINRRMMNGEFGNPVNMDLVNAAWADILDTEVKDKTRL